ncbi:MAG: MFS transporter [Rhizobiaceae bacterium]|nr:MFS transporter [Rhizobiaceae bacterium]
MKNKIFSLSALLLGSGFLFFAGGLNGLILPVRGAAEGFSAFSLGLLGTGWAVGYIAGCLYVPRLVTKVGHVRSFSVMAAVASLSILLSALIVFPSSWIILRSLSGFAFAGAAMIVESWLTSTTEPKERGSVFGTYTMINLLGSTLGQLSIATSGELGLEFFIIGAVFYSLALLPTAVSASSTPAPLSEAKLDLKALWLNSPIAVVAVVCVGVSNGAFGTLGAVYAGDIGLSVGAISLFMSAPILAGALSQIPVGYASDHMDRRYVLLIVGILAIVADLMFITVATTDPTILIIKAAGFGALIFVMYPIIIAHANDHAKAGSALQVTSGLLLLQGVGTISGPLVAGGLMSIYGPQGLFIVVLIAHIVIVVYAIYRMAKRRAVAAADKARFILSNPLRGSTPQTPVLSGRSMEKISAFLEEKNRAAEKDKDTKE